MLPGPVFSFEILATARRGRFYLVRSFYATVLLVILWTVHTAWTAKTRGKLLSFQVTWFALSAFGAIAVGQEILTLALTPALVAGVIADEKQRKTLHYLLASRLSSPEIVLGKLLVRMLYLMILVGVSLPVLSLLVLLGGDRPATRIACLFGEFQHRLVPRGAFDLGLDDRPPCARRVCYCLRTRGSLARLALTVSNFAELEMAMV